MKEKKINHFASMITISTFLIIYFCFFFYGCKSPASPEEPPFQKQYRDVVEFTYTRDSSKIIDTDHENVPVQIRYALQDFSGGTYAPDEEYFYDLRIADVDMEKIGKYKFRINFKHVLIHEGAEEEWWWGIKYMVILMDRAVSHPIDEKDIKIEGAYDLNVYRIKESSTQIWFRMSKN